MYEPSMGSALKMRMNDVHFLLLSAHIHCVDWPRQVRVEVNILSMPGWALRPCGIPTLHSRVVSDEAVGGTALPLLFHIQCGEASRMHP